MANQEITGKYSLELNFVGDGRVFLNFWDGIHGNDVIAEVRQGRLFENTDNGKEELYIGDFVRKVIESIKKRTV